MKASSRLAWALLLLVLVTSASIACAGKSKASSKNQANKARKYRRWTPDAFPNPRKDTTACGRGVASSLCDPEGILALESANMVDGLINEIAEGKSPFKKAQCDDKGMQGFAVAVALMHHVDHKLHPDKAAAARSLAKSLHDAWGVGNPACQNGVLLLLAIGDRQAYISSGAGVKELVSDTQLSMVLDNIRPALQHKRYADAVLEAVQQLGLLLAGQEPDPGSGVDADDGLGIFAFFCASVASVMGWAWFSNRRQQGRFKTCADRLAAIKRDQAAIRSRQYAAATCPICLEDFDAPVQPADAAAAAAAGRASNNSGGAGGSGSSGAGPSSSSSAAAGGASSSRAAPQQPEEEEEDERSGLPSAPLLSSAAAAAGAGVGPKAKGGGGKGGGGKGGGRKPLVLRCGHAFCDPCISEWLKSHTNCPICRKDLDDDSDTAAAAAAAAAAPPPGTSCAAAARAVAPEELVRQQVWIPELGFRLRRLRLMYPDLVTDPMLYAWEEDLAAGRALDESGLVQQFQANNPQRQAELERGGRFGASSSAHWGGGSSRGGGGAGSSW